MPTREERTYEQFFEDRITEEEREVIQTAGMEMADYVYRKIMHLSLDQGFQTRDEEWEEFAEKVKSQVILALDSMIP